MIILVDFYFLWLANTLISSSVLGCPSKVYFIVTPSPNTSSSVWEFEWCFTEPSDD